MWSSSLTVQAPCFLVTHHASRIFTGPTTSLVIRLTSLHLLRRAINLAKRSSERIKDVFDRLLA